jgi:hypothetical protein
MNKAQISCMWLGIVVIAIMALYPPFMDSETGNFVGYDLFTASYKDDQKIDTLWESFVGESSPRKVTVDYSRLKLQCGVAFLIMIAFILSAKSEKQSKNSESVQNPKQLE